MAKRNIIQYKNTAQIDKIRESGKFLTILLHELYDMCVPGRTTLELEIYAETYIRKNGLKWAFKWYGWFPTNLCTSVNDCVVHGVPNKTPLVNGDLLKVDCGIDLWGAISDAAFSIVIWWSGKNTEASELIAITKKALDIWIKTIKVWVNGKTFGKAVHKAIYDEDFTVIKHLTGHGVGNAVHEFPSVYNRPQNSMKKRRFEPGMVLALEPITAQVSEDYIEHIW